jgi:TonB family protein
MDGEWVGRRLLTALCATLLAVSTAEAQVNPSKPSPISAWAASVTKTLRLDAAQSAVLDRYLATISQQLAPTDTDTPDAFRALTTPQRLDYIAAHLETDLAEVRARAAAMRAFYATLSPEQRALLDALMLPRPGHLATGSDTISDEPPPAPNYRLPSHVEPDWMIKPTPDEVARVYPAAAVEARISGKVIMACIADVDGFLTECVIEEETPPGYGFGNAALEISAYMRMKPASNFGVPIRAKVNLPVNFMLPESGSQSR